MRESRSEYAASEQAAANADTERRFARSIRTAFREWPESAVGIDGPPEPIPSPPLWARLLRPLLVRPERTCQ